MKSEYIRLKEYIDESKNTAVVTGAGISYLYGVRRLKQSVGMMNYGKVFSAAYIRKNPEKFYKIIKNAFLDATFVKGPSIVHRQLAELEKQGKIQGIATQNLDCLHTIAGSENVVEFQGSFRDNICIDCGNRSFDYKVWGQGRMPRCKECGGYIMPTGFCRENPISTNVSRENMNKAANMISKADLVIVIGTTGFRSEEYLSRMQPKTRLVQINPSPTQFDRITALNIRAEAAEVLEAVLKG